jgi:hypothetical protein
MLALETWNALSQDVGIDVIYMFSLSYKFILFNSGIDSSLLEELSDIEQVRDDMACVSDNGMSLLMKA